MKKIIITENEGNQRLDRYLIKLLASAGKGTVQKLIRKKVCKINGRRVSDPAECLKKDDVLEIFLSDGTFEELSYTKKYEVELEEFGIGILYEDDDLLVCLKPSGMLTHPDKGEYKNTLSTKVQGYLSHLCTPTFRPSPIHRLDLQTSGIVLFAKNYPTLQKYNALMRERKIRKFYHAVVEGRMKKKGVLEGYLRKDGENNKAEILPTLSEGATSQETREKYIKTLYRPLKAFAGFTLVEVELVTGRTHQIRAGMQFLGHPIVGDKKYGSRYRREGAQLLHCHRIEADGHVFEAAGEEIVRFMERYSDRK